MNRLPRACLFASLSLIGACHVGGGANTPQSGLVSDMAEAYQPRAISQRGEAPLFLVGMPVQQRVQYSVVGNQAVMEGDILLGAPNSLLLRYGLPHAPQRNVYGAVALADKSYLWPDGVIPYEIRSSISSETAGWIRDAIAMFSGTALRFREKTASDKDYVFFQASSGGGCASYIGRVGGAQEIDAGDCGPGSLAHEIMHAAGFYHEQSRGDRDEHVTVVMSEVSPGYENNFDKRDWRGQDIGDYDYGSIMHYGAKSFSRSGNPTIVPKVAGVRIGQRGGLSAGDRAGVAALYGAAPSTPSQPSQPNTPAQPSTPSQPNTPTQPNTPPAVASTGFAGNYSSSRGTVTCTQNGSVVSCQYPGGMMMCTAADNTRLDCGWSGGGQGRAAFQRQSSGILAGTWGDWLSANSRGEWSLTPTGAAQAPSAPQAPTQPSQPTQPSTVQAASLSGSFQSTRGPMTCSDSGASLACTFQENGASGRVDCVKDTTGLRFSCGWFTYLPSLGSGRATFTRASASDRNLTGTWGMLGADSGAGTWEIRAQ